VESQTQPAEQLADKLSLLESAFEERIAELELELAIEDKGWTKLGGYGEFEFTRDALRKITRESRLFYLKNPLVKRACETKSNYVFGQGVTIQARNPLVDQVVQSFLSDEKNKSEVTTPLSMHARDLDLQTDANLFLAFFTNASGDVRVRSIPFDEIDDILCNPEDRKEPWFYLRKKGMVVNTLGQVTQEGKDVLYPDWQYHPQNKPATYEDKPVEWNTPVYHVKTNALGDHRFGVSEIYAAHDWARAYNEFLSNWATIVRALARFAWKVVTKGGADKRARMKTALDSGIESGATITNPPPSTGSIWLESEGTNLQPIKTSGATTSAADGRRLLLMVCAATGIFEHYLGDPSTGNLATAKSMERPMELMFLLRQMLWKEIHENILSFAIEAKARAGTLKGLSGYDEPDGWNESKFVYNPDPEGPSDEPIDISVAVTFPDLVEEDAKAKVDAVVSAATLNGQQFAGTLDAEYTTRLLLIALGEKSVEEVMDDLFPPQDQLPAPESMRQTAAELRETIKGFLTLLKEAKVADAD